MKKYFCLIVVILLWVGIDAITPSDLQRAIANGKVIQAIAMLEKYPFWVNEPFNHTTYFEKVVTSPYKIRNVQTIFQAAATALKRDKKGQWSRGSMDHLVEFMLSTGNVDATVTNIDGMNILHYTADPRLSKSFTAIAEYCKDHCNEILDGLAIGVGTPLMFLISKDRTRGNPAIVGMIKTLVDNGIDPDPDNSGEPIALNSAAVDMMKNKDLRSFRVLYEEFFIDVEDMDGMEPAVVKKLAPNIAFFLCIYGETLYCQQQKK
jgi:hypothetical protein